MIQNMSIKSLHFQKLYQQHWSELYAFAYNVVHDKGKAEDMVQDVFVDLWNRYDEVSIQHYRGYLFQSVKNQCAKNLSSHTFKEVHLEKLTGLLSEVDEPPYEEIKKLLLEEINTTATQVLPEKCFQIFKLRFFESLSYKEISSQLHISESTVENQISKALKLLKESTRYISDLHIALLFFIQLTIT